MIALLSDAIIMISFSVFLLLLYKSYRAYRPKPLLYFIIGVSTSLTAFTLDFIAILLSDEITSLILFRLFGVISISAMVFYMSYIEFSISEKPRWRFYLFLFYIGLSAGLRSFSNLEIKFKNGYILRGTFYLNVFGIEVLNLVIVFALIWFYFEILHLTYKQYLNVRRPVLRKYLKYFIIVLIASIVTLIIGITLYYAGIIDILYSPPLLNSLLLIFLIGEIYFNYKVPTFSFIASQKTFGAIVMKISNNEIINYFVDETVKQYTNLISSMIKALIVASENLMNLGKISLIGLDELKIIVRSKEDVLLGLLVDSPSPIHYSILDRMILEVSKIQTLDNANDFSKLVIQKIERYLDPLIP